MDFNTEQVCYIQDVLAKVLTAAQHVQFKGKIGWLSYYADKQQHNHLMIDVTEYFPFIHGRVFMDIIKADYYDKRTITKQVKLAVNSIPSFPYDLYILSRLQDISRLNVATNHAVQVDSEHGHDGNFHPLTFW